MKLHIITPEKTLYSSDRASSVICPGTDGAFQLLDHHSPIVSALKKGTLIITDHDHSNKPLEFPIVSGLVECAKNTVNILVEVN